MKKYFLCFIINLLSGLCCSQSIQKFRIPDSLANQSYEQLSQAYDKVFQVDNAKAEFYANTILLKGKKENNNRFIYDGYYKIAHIKGLKTEKGYPYADTLLSITRHINSHEYPAKAYIIKGILLNYDFRYQEALDYYIQAQRLSKYKNPDQFYYIKKLIGILKTATDENKEALPLFLAYYNYQKNKLTAADKDIKSYIGSIFSVSNAYNKNKNYKQCKLYNRIGIEACNEYSDYTHYNYFVMSEGIADYYLKNYSAAYNSFILIENKLAKNKDYANLSILYYFLAKINNETGKHKQAIHYLIKSDSLSVISNEFMPVTRDGYEILIDHYKKNGDKENQLKYINKLFYADSIINNSQKYLSKEIYKKYDTPILLEEKEGLIDDLSNKNVLLYWLSAIGLILTAVLIYVYIKNRKKIRDYERQAELLFIASKESLPLPGIEKFEFIEDSVQKSERSRNNVLNERIRDINVKLNTFEKNKVFLQQNLTLDSLAKDLKTNRDYLSKSVNELKGKSFPQYLNELRINYIVEELKNNKKLRKLTILAIANDIGYRSSESFANAFKKITGTLPSYYIKLLQKQDEEKFIDN